MSSIIHFTNFNFAAYNVLLKIKMSDLFTNIYSRWSIRLFVLCVVKKHKLEYDANLDYHRDWTAETHAKTAQRLWYALFGTL